MFCQLLNSIHVSFLIWKGAALAYDIYSDPLLRPRIDTDILILTADKKKIFSLLESSGYVLQNSQHELLGQATFTMQINQLTLVYDVHWEVFAQQSLKSLFGFSELWSMRKRLNHISAFTVCDEMALVLCSMHWVAHHYAYPEPRWITDLRLLSAGRSAEWWQRVKHICEEKQIRRIVDATLTKSRIKTPWTKDELNMKEPFDYLFLPGRGPISDFYQDWQKMSPTQRWRVLSKHILPNADYMREKYGFKSPLWLPLFYVYRMCRGFTKSIRIF